MGRLTTGAKASIATKVWSAEAKRNYWSNSIPCRNNNNNNQTVNHNHNNNNFNKSESFNNLNLDQHSPHACDTQPQASGSSTGFTSSLPSSSSKLAFSSDLDTSSHTPLAIFGDNISGCGDNKPLPGEHQSFVSEHHSGRSGPSVAHSWSTSTWFSWPPCTSASSTWCRCSPSTWTLARPVKSFGSQSGSALSVDWL